MGILFLIKFLTMPSGRDFGRGHPDGKNPVKKTRRARWTRNDAFGASAYTLKAAYFKTKTYPISSANAAGGLLICSRGNGNPWRKTARSAPYARYAFPHVRPAKLWEYNQNRHSHEELGIRVFLVSVISDDLFSLSLNV